MAIEADSPVAPKRRDAPKNPFDMDSEPSERLDKAALEPLNPDRALRGHGLNCPAMSHIVDGQ